MQPGALKRLKTAIPAKPGLYEWGVRLPADTTAAHLAAAAAAVAAGGGAAAVRGVAAPGSSSSNAASSGVRTRSGAGGLAQGQPRVEYGPVVCFYLGKAGESKLRVVLNTEAGSRCYMAAGRQLFCSVSAYPPEGLFSWTHTCCVDRVSTSHGCTMCAGTLSGARRLRQLRSAMAGAAATAGTGTATAAAAATGPGETLRTRFNKYALTKAGRLGPVREPHKDALFAQLQAAGGQLCFRWAAAWLEAWQALVIC